MKGEEMGSQVTISDMQLVTQRMKVHLTSQLWKFMLTWAVCSPDGESYEQTGGTAIDQAAADLDVERCTDSSSNADKLDVSRFQFSMGQVKAGFDTACVVCVGHAIPSLERSHNGALARATAHAIATRVGPHAAGNGGLVSSMGRRVFLVKHVRHDDYYERTLRERSEEGR